MITYEEALEIVETEAMRLDNEVIELHNSLNRILAVDVISDMNMPPFDKSAMDGYACRKKDIKNELRILETIPAGQIPKERITENTCSKIMTGAMIPAGAECVLKIEETQKTGELTIRLTVAATKPNICYKGEDIKFGEKVLTKGILLKPQHIAVLASVGCAKVVVSRLPKIAVLPTGDELVEPDQNPSISQIRNSNGPQLVAQLHHLGIKATYNGIVSDSEQATLKAIRTATDANDVVLITGGVSMGDFDFVPRKLEEAGYKILFRTIAIQPGKPTVFARKGNTFCFGLPGNPVSSFVQFEMLVKPFIYKLMGYNYKPAKIRMPMAVEYSRKHTTRMSLLPVTFTEQGSVLPLDYHGSAHIYSLIDADGIIAIPINVSQLRKGEPVDVRQI